MIRLLLLSILFPLSLQLTAQTEDFVHVNYRGDTVIYKTILEPSVCDCIKRNYINTDQDRICNKKYDYDFMSDEEKEEYDFQKQICRNPSICDCAMADMKNRGLVKACDKRYLNRSWITDDERKEYLKQMSACKEEDRTIYRLRKEAQREITICDCINIPSHDYKLKQKCNKEYLNEEELGEEVVAENQKKLLECASNNQVSLNPSICDCARFKDTDEEYRKACKSKFEYKATDSLEKADYYNALARCEDLKLYERLESISDSLRANSTNNEMDFAMEDFGSFPPPPPSLGGRGDLEDALRELQEMSEQVEFAYEGYNQPKEPQLGELLKHVNDKIKRTIHYEICECENLESKDKFRVNRCLELYPIEHLSPAEWKQLQDMKKNCKSKK